MLSKKHTFSFKTILTMLAFVLFSVNSYAQSGSVTLMIGQNTSSEESVYTAVSSLGLRISDEIAQLNIVCVEVPSSEAAYITAQLKRHASVQFVEEKEVINGDS